MSDGLIGGIDINEEIVEGEFTTGNSSLVSFDPICPAGKGFRASYNLLLISELGKTICRPNRERTKFVIIELMRLNATYIRRNFYAHDSFDFN